MGPVSPVKRRKPLEDCVELALFPAAVGKAPAKGPRTGEEAATKRVRPIGYAPCPRCSKARAAVIHSGSHSVWKAHTLTTWGGCPLPCAASGVSLCTLPAVVEAGAAPLSCPH